MDTSLSKYMFTGNADISQALIKPTAKLGQKQSVSTQLNADKTVTNHDTQVIAKKDFNTVLGKKTKLKSTPKTQSDKKTKEQNTDPTQALIALPGKPIVSPQDKKVVSTSMKLANKVIDKSIEPAQTSPEIVLLESGKNSKILDIKPENSENGEKIVASDKPLAIKEKLFNPENTEKLLKEIPSSDSKTAIAGKNTTVPENAVAAKEKLVNQEIGKKLSQETTPSDNKPTIAANKALSSEIPELLKSNKTATVSKVVTDSKNDNSKKEIFELPKNSDVKSANIPAKSIAPKVNSQRPQISASAAQIQVHNEQSSNNSSGSQTQQGEQALVSGNIGSEIAEQLTNSSDSASFAKTIGNTATPASVAQQVQESINTSLRAGSQQVTIRLNPANLGNVEIKFTEQGNEITGILQVDKAQTRDQIQQQLPAIIQNLQGHGIAIKKLEVVLTNSQDQYSFKDQSAASQENFSQQQSQNQSQSGRGDGSYANWPSEADTQSEFAQPSTQFIDKSINMLA